jgi:hypothetical protein
MTQLNLNQRLIKAKNTANYLKSGVIITFILK